MRAMGASEIVNTAAEAAELGLAPLLVRDIFRILQDINRAGTSLLLVEQNARMALNAAARGYVLETGRLVLQGTGRELANHPRVKEAYLG